MKSLASGARLLPSHHVTIRVPWHDSGWAGSLCARPVDNTSCLVLPRIGAGKVDKLEQECSRRRLDSLSRAQLPPCIADRVSFMAPFELVRAMRHPYAESSPDTHGHLLETRFVQPPYTAACVPFRWMLRQVVEGDPKQGIPSLAEQLQLGWTTDREPELSFEPNWVQERDNQLVMLDTFFGAIRPEESLCFFYAKRTPLSEQSRRVIIGVGRVLSVGQSTEHAHCSAPVEM